MNCPLWNTSVPVSFMNMIDPPFSYISLSFGVACLFSTQFAVIHGTFSSVSILMALGCSLCHHEIILPIDFLRNNTLNHRNTLRGYTGAANVLSFYQRVRKTFES